MYIMKIFSLITAIVILGVLTSCTSTDTPENTLDTNTSEVMAEELKGSVVLDLNHPLAGKKLNFDVEMVEFTKSASGVTVDTVENGDTVKVHYTGTLEDGEKFDSSLDRGEPLEFTVGAGQMIPGFDAGVVGMKLEEKKSLVLEAKDAYGERDDSQKQTVPKKDLASFVNAGIELKVGEKLPTQFGELEILEVTD